MLSELIIEPLESLKQELERLKTATDYIEGAKENSKRIILELEQLQDRYSEALEKIYSLNEKHSEELKKNLESEIGNSTLKLENIAVDIAGLNSEKTKEIKTLFEDQLSGFKDYLESEVDRSVTKLGNISDQIERSNKERIEESKQQLEQHLLSLKDSTESKITGSIAIFEKIGREIERSYKEKNEESKRLLDHYRAIVSATENLMRSIDSVDFPSRFAYLEKKLHDTNNSFLKSIDSIEYTANELEKSLKDMDFSKISDNLNSEIRKVSAEIKESEQSIKKYIEFAHNSLKKLLSKKDEKFEKLERMEIMFYATSGGIVLVLILQIILLFKR